MSSLKASSTHRTLAAPEHGAERPRDVVPASELVSRRRFMGTLAASIAALGLEGCDEPEHIVPYVRRPPEVVPGVSRLYATTALRAGYGIGVLVESREGRPIKVEGHPEHPASLGATLVQEQASLFNLYDADRARALRHGADVQSWRAFVAAFAAGAGQPWRRARGRGLCLLLQPTSSPLVGWLLAQLQGRYPEAKIFFDPGRAPVSRWAAMRQLFGRVVEPQHRFDEARRVVDLDANFLVALPMSVPWSRGFAAGRAIEDPRAEMNRLYSIESLLSVTGANADHRLPVGASKIGHVAAALLAAVGEQAGVVPPPVLQAARRHLHATEHRPWLEAAARDLNRHRGRAPVIVGEHQPPAVHVMAQAINHALGNPGVSVGYTRSALFDAGGGAYDLDGLLEALDAGGVDSLFMLEGNPAYSLTPDARFAERVTKARQRVLLSLYENETAPLATWFVPALHFLERWGDARAYDGTASLRQPLIRPIFGGRSVEDVLSVLIGAPERGTRELLHRHWAERLGDERSFEEALAHGLLPRTRFQLEPAELDWAAVEAAVGQLEVPTERALELNLLPDPKIEDGSLGNNIWLQELPDPITKLTWGNAALVAPRLAAELGVEDGDRVRIKRGHVAVDAPALIVPGQAPDAIGMWTGYGRRGAESVARGVGVDVNPLRRASRPWVVPAVTLEKLADRAPLATTQQEPGLHGRPIFLRKSQQAWRRHPELAEAHDEPPRSLLPDRSGSVPQWGMSVDLNKCTGCSTCVIACVVENNIPAVGADQVRLGREMAWLRVDRYFEGPSHAPRVGLQPMMCQHCEKAPCEYVCPVNATTHSPDGLNEMTYNRCVGTRYCSNNCPYKVRRFNYFDFNRSLSQVRTLVHNPDVTVRARGVMEKCTYCVQRIRRAQIDAKLQERSLGDGELVTACAQACPTGAIVFGAVSDPSSEVSQQQRSPRSYGVLSEIGTRPRTRYLARIDNPNEEIET